MYPQIERVITMNIDIEAILQRVYEYLAQYGFKVIGALPYPQRDIHLKSGVFQSSKPV